MTEAQVIITNKTGLHARPAAQFVQKAASFTCKVTIFGNNKKADGKSILGVMSTGLTQHMALTIMTEGKDEEECIAALMELIESNFGEG